MVKYIAIVCFLFFFNALYSQVNSSLPVKSKLISGEYINRDFNVVNGDTLYKKFRKEFRVFENSDTILFIELFDINRFWYLERYKIINGKSLKSGWQKEFDLGGNLLFEKYCSAETRDCNKVNAYTYYPNGNIIAIVKTVKNKRESNSLFFHNNGMLKNSIEYKDGKLWNILAYYDQYGNVLDQGNFCDGTGTVNVYAVNGRLINIKEYKNGRQKILRFKKRE